MIDSGKKVLELLDGACQESTKILAHASRFEGIMTHPNVRIGKIRNKKSGGKLKTMGDNAGTGAARAPEIVVDCEQTLTKSKPELDPIDALVLSDESDTVSVDRDDIFEKAKDSPADEFRKAFHGRANSHKGVNWRADFR
jgi:hypothetical protein